MISFHKERFYSSIVITAKITDYVYSYFFPIQNLTEILQVHWLIKLETLYGYAIIKFFIMEKV
jgi:hypothetical protein